jgi:hypothetical protein
MHDLRWGVMVVDQTLINFTNAPHQASYNVTSSKEELDLLRLMSIAIVRQLKMKFKILGNHQI